MAHKDICIRFELDGQPFEAVGFLNEGEKSILKEEALRRCDNGALIVKQDDFDFIFQHRRELLREKYQTRLVTGVQEPGFSSGCIRTLIQQGPPFGVYVDMKSWNEWTTHWLGNLWWCGMSVNSTALVIRRAKTVNGL